MSWEAVLRGDVSPDQLHAMRAVRVFGDPILKTATREVERFDEALGQQAVYMRQIMDLLHGIGLAAPQVGSLSRLLVYRPAPEAPAAALVNPRLEWASEEQAVEVEGCLSLPGVQVPVLRALAVKVSAQDLEGARHELDLEGFAARVVQHEMDHLDGILILDRTDREYKRDAVRMLRGRMPDAQWGVSSAENAPPQL